MASHTSQLAHHELTQVLSGSPPPSSDCCDAVATLDAGLIELLDLRVSLINGCLLCVRHCFHRATRVNVPLAKAENVERWRRATVFTPRERAALLWVEQLASTVGLAADTIRSNLKDYFDDVQIAELCAYWKRSDLLWGRGVIRCCVGAQSSI